MRLIAPPGYSLYGGATLSCYQSADGSYFWACSGKAGGSPLLYVYVFRQAGDGQASTVVDYGGRADGRGTLTLLDGEDLYLSAWTGNEANLYKIPGWQRHLPTPTPQPAPVPAGMVQMPQAVLQYIISTLMGYLPHA